MGGAFFYKLFLPPWKIIDIQSTHPDSLDILFVDYHYTSDDPVDDILYVKTQSGDIYSIFHNAWSSIPPLPSGNTISEIRRRDGYADSPIIAITSQDKVFQLIDNKWETLENPKEPYWGAEPLQCSNWRKRLPIRKIVDSAGVIFEHALADSTKCYVLFNDGSLEVWTRTQDAFSMIGTVGASTLLGAIAMSAIGFKMKSLRN
jgi:hypothetical protein